jgi:hypothetical protein
MAIPQLEIGASRCSMICSSSDEFHFYWKDRDRLLIYQLRRLCSEEVSQRFGGCSQLAIVVSFSIGNATKTRRHQENKIAF